MAGPDGSPLRVIHRIRSLGDDTGRDEQAMILRTEVVIVPIVNQPIARGVAINPLIGTKADKQHAPAIVRSSRQDFMIAVLLACKVSRPVRRRTHCGNRNICSGAIPTRVGVGSEGAFGRCGRCCVFHWSRLFKTLVNI